MTNSKLAPKVYRLNATSPQKETVIVTTTMKVFVALIAGALSGFLIYMTTSMLFMSASDPTPSWFVPVVFLGGWGISTYLLLRGARTASEVISRAFLLGAAEWFAIILETTDELSSDAEMAGATIGAGLITFITGGVAIVMIFVCLLGYIITFLINREMKSEAKS